MRLATTINTCASTGLHWVSVLARKTIPAASEVYVPYGKAFPRPWRKANTTPAMMIAAPPGDEQQEWQTDITNKVRDTLVQAVSAATMMPKQAMAGLAALWNDAVQ